MFMKHRHVDSPWTVGSMGLEFEGNPLWGGWFGVVGIETDKSVGAGKAQRSVWNEERKMLRIELWGPLHLKGWSGKKS